MHYERRRVIRRAFAGGVLFAGLSAVPLCLIELLYVLLIRRPSFGSYGEALSFGFHLHLLLISVALVMGLFEGLLILGVSHLTQVFAKKRVHEPRWMAWIYSILALPVIAVISAKVFAGRQAQLIPGKDVIAVLLGLTGLLATYGFLRLIIGCRDRFRLRRWGPRQAALFTPLCLLVAVGFYAADRSVLVGLYGYFHVGLALGAMVFCQLAMAALHAAYRPTVKWFGKFLEPSLSLLLLLGAVAGAAWSLSCISTSEQLRFLYHEHTVVQSKVLSLARWMNLLPSRGQSLAGAAVAPIKPEPGQSLLTGPRTPEANLVLLSVDALRADHLGVYGYHRDTSPHLDAWARHAVWFERAYCQVPHTSFSVTSLLTGNYIFSLNRVNPGKRYITLPEVLRRYSYKTAAFFPPAVFYIDRESFTAFEKSKYGFEFVKYEFLDAKRRVDQILAFLRQEKRRPVFIWAHFFDPHEPYLRHPEHDFGPRGVDRYDAEIAFVDHQVGRLLAYITKEMPRTYVALTADHGEAFGEHGTHYHGNSLIDPQVRVPLILSGPGITPRKVAGAGQVIDLPVTFLGLVDVPQPAGMRGTNLGPWLVGEKARLLPPVFTELGVKKMVVAEHHKLICDTARDFCQLYDLVQDPAERRNIMQKRPKVAARLQGALVAWMSSHHSSGSDPHTDVARLLARGRQKDSGAIDGLIKICRGELEDRREAVAILTAMRSPRAKEALLQASLDPDPGVHIQGTIGAALLGHAESLQKLRSLLKRTDLPPLMRRDALLAQVKAGDRSGTLALTRYLKESEDIYERTEIIISLGELGDVTAGPALMTQLQTLRTRHRAIEALGKIRAKIAVPELLRSLQQDRYTSWRKASAQALGLIGQRRSTPALHQVVLRELEADVVAAALVALERLKGLPIPKVSMISARKWECRQDQCTLTVADDCARLAQDELLLLARPKEQPDEPGRTPPAVTVTCGSVELKTITLTGLASLVLGVPEKATGSLQLHAHEPPELPLLAIRSVPRGERASN